MATHIAYRESIHRKPEDCLAAVAAGLTNGWQVSEVRKEGRSFVVLFSQERREAPESRDPHAQAS